MIERRIPLKQEEIKREFHIECQCCEYGFGSNTTPLAGQIYKCPKCNQEFILGKKYEGFVRSARVYVVYEQDRDSHQISMWNWYYSSAEEAKGAVLAMCEELTEDNGLEFTEIKHTQEVFSIASDEIQYTVCLVTPAP